MNEKTSLKNTFVTGFALFAMFLGAGNLIFPPYIGIRAGNLYFVALLGFLFTGILMPLLGLLSTSKIGGNLYDLSNVVSRRFSIIFNVLILVSIGPLLAIPRTSATAFEVGVIPIFGDINLGKIFGIEIFRIIISALYFFINLIFVLRPSKVIDAIGKYFTPVLLLLLISLIVKGIISPIGVPGEPSVSSPFTIGFKEGYQTMDALASMAFAGIAVSSIRKRYSDEKIVWNESIKSSVIAALGLLIVYGGFIYLGATGSIVFKDIDRTQATVKLVRAIGSEAGKVSLSISMTVACLTTSIGLITTIADFFKQLTKNKFSYKNIVYIVTAISFIISIFGVNQIIYIAGPILSTLYPASIVLIILNLFRKHINRRGLFRGAVIGATLIGIFYGIESVLPHTFIVENILYKLPLGKDGFFWIITAIIGGIIGYMVDKSPLPELKKVL